MNLEGKRLTREELYEEVWRAPLTRLAAEWGVSPSAIVQACEEMNVPRPGSGHWTFIRRGWAVPRPDLPGQESGTLESVVIKGPQPRYGRRSTGIDTRSIVKAEVPCIPVHKELNVPHPLVAQMRNVFKEAKLGRIFSVRDLWPSGRLFRVQVSTAQVTRTLCILDALVKALEKRGAKFEPKHDSRHLMELRKDGETVDFLLSEEMEKRERIAKDEDERRSIWWTKSEYFSTGRLRFVIDGYAPAACKKKWADCSDYRLEEKVGEMMQSIFAVFEGIKTDRAKTHEQMRIREEERRKEGEAERLRQVEQMALKNLEEQAVRWARANQLRDFVAACERALCVEGQLSSEWVAKWLTWAREHAERLDPLLNGFLESERRRTRSGAEGDGG